MFEKEAEERTKQYMNKNTKKYNCECTKLETDNYNVGREYGYEEGFKDGAEFGYNKANKWHFVKDGDLPKDEKDVQVLFQDCNKINSYTCLYDIHSESWLYYNLDNMLLEPFDYKVIAWKEIVPPELPKEIKEND